MSDHAEMIEAGSRMWLLNVVNGRATGWRPVEVIVPSYLPLVETEDGRRFQVFRHALYWQPNARTDLPVLPELTP